MRRVLPVLLAAGLIIGTGWWALTLYTGGPDRGPPDPRTPRHLALARAALARGLARDSAGVAALSGDPEPVVWLADAVRRDSALVAAWTEGEPKLIDFRQGDTTYLIWSTDASARRCKAGGRAELTALVVEAPATGTDAKLVRLASRCLKPAPITIEIGSADSGR